MTVSAIDLLVLAKLVSNVSRIVHDETKVILNILIQLKAVYDLHSRLLPSHNHAKCKSHIIYSYFSILVSDILVLKSNMN